MSDRPGDGPPDAEGRIAALQAMYLAGQVEGVSVVAADATACEACRAVADRTYVPARLPRLPLSDCTRPGGCRCGYEALTTVYE